MITACSADDHPLQVATTADSVEACTRTSAETLLKTRVGYGNKRTILTGKAGFKFRASRKNPVTLRSLAFCSHRPLPFSPQSIGSARRDCVFKFSSVGNSQKSGKMAENLREGLLVGIGNPLLDISATVDQDFLKKYNLKSNDAILADEIHKPLYDELIEQYKADFIAGGAVQNSMRVAQWFLEKPCVCIYMGCVGKDKYSKILEDRARENGLNVRYQYTEKEQTGTCAVLITGKERSLCANLAAANHFSPSHIEDPENKKLIENAQFFYVSGFFLTVSPETIQAVAKHAFEENKVFMMNLSANFLCELFKKPMRAALPYVDILFGNESEAETFSKENDLGTMDRKEIALKIANMEKINTKRKRIVIITQGCDSVILAKDNVITEFPVTKLPEEKLVDTNGAGDAFVGGFLAQYIQDRSLETCIKCGIWAATQIVQRSGCTYEGKPNFAA
ncbi:adenosine kinase 2-like isoform X1 [Belonocnema kinseyi]|uniref:adenosine kinase 2-like isoform X1 n=1 Tax=Belonocnema kinseyi TaxID=2817044 RepID=UPI00143D2A36|nr:adenosine kinase 2-like isoform X1 [Belonocnema kinseyi]XP_033209463.1 adenosine kinase 2-like isoform X1 [Belonocnema kinseyi]